MKGIKNIFAFVAHILHQRDIRSLKKLDGDLDWRCEMQAARGDMGWFPDLEEVISLGEYKKGREGLRRVIRRSMKYGFENPFKGSELEDICVFRRGLL